MLTYTNPDAHLFYAKTQTSIMCCLQISRCWITNSSCIHTVFCVLQGIKKSLRIRKKNKELFFLVIYHLNVSVYNDEITIVCLEESIFNLHFWLCDLNEICSRIIKNFNWQVYSHFL